MASADRGTIKSRLRRSNANYFDDLADSIHTQLDANTFAVDASMKQPGKLLVDIDNDTSIYTLVSGHTYFWGTATGLPGATDNANAITFALPTPTQAGEYICILPQNASAIAKLVGFTTVDEATVTIQYQAYEPTANNTALIEQATTTAGVHGTANTMVKLAASHLLVGDEIHCYSLSATKWLMRIVGRNNLIAAGDIAPDPGNVGGYID
tara:strand:- start:88 stop:717 length:630 start_codon:yes stop_codon:yes gene_type:complete